MTETLQELVERHIRNFRSPEETNRLLRNQVWHYSRDMRTDWNTGGCEAERVENAGISVPDRRD